VVKCDLYAASAQHIAHNSVSITTYTRHFTILTHKLSNLPHREGGYGL